MTRDLAIDLGTANILVCRPGEGIVFNEPTVVALDGNSGEVLAVGDEAWQMIGGGSRNVLAVRPLRAGSMTEFDITQRMLQVVLRLVADIEERQRQASIDLGEQVVEPLDGTALAEKDVRAHLRTHLADYKVPKAIEIARNLPREDSGKIFKRRLRDPYWQGAGRRI